MAEIIVQNLNKYFGDFHLLKDISFEIEKGQRVGIVGNNGAGKTTLFKILTGVMDFESGSFYKVPKKIGILDQLPNYPIDMTVRQVLWQAFENIEKMAEQLKALEKKMEVVAIREVMDEYAKLLEQFELADGYNLEVMYAKMTNGLNIPPEMQERCFMSLSGGEKTRVNLARTMLYGTEILLLDEPTNHLDVRSVQWLEQYLSTFKGAAVVISHDRYFLDKVTNVTMELEEGKLRTYPYAYSKFVEEKEREAAALEEAKKRQDKEIARLEHSVQRMKGWGTGSSKLMKRAFGMEKRLLRIERIQTMRKTHKMKNKFSGATRSGDEVFYLDKLSVGFDKPLTLPFTSLVLRGERIAILGENGCGKTTLLKTLLNTINPISGKVLEGASLKGGFLPQEISFDRPDRTVLETMLYATNMPVADCRDRLGAYGFSGEEVFKVVRVLSGGEKVRLRLCIFMHDQINTLFLDEPTNHLDILSREWLEDSLEDFDGTMLFVSHDRYFINRFATRIWQIENGQITDFVGGYEEWGQEEKRLAQSVQKQPKPLAEKVEPKNTSGKKVQSYNDKKAVRDIENQVAKLERELEFFDSEIAKHATDYEKLAQAIQAKEQAETELLKMYEKLESYGG